MHGLQTLAKLNREAAQANRSLNAARPAAEKPDHHIELAPAPERLAKMHQLLNAAKG